MGTKLGGVSAFLVAMSRAESDRTRQDGYVLFFSRVSEGTLGTFWGSILERFGHEIRWRFSVSSGGHEQQQQQEQQEGSMSHCTNSRSKTILFF